MTTKVTISDIKSCVAEYGLARQIPDGRVVDTLIGRVVKQIIRNQAFSAFAIGSQEDNSKPPVEQAQDNILLEISTMPYKDGIDASPEGGEVIQMDPLNTMSPRKDLIFDLIYTDSSKDPEIYEKAAAQLKKEAVELFIQTRMKNRNSKLASSKIGKTIAIGLEKMEVDDGEHDESFITRAVEFLLQYKDQLFNPMDQKAAAYLEAIITGTLRADETPEEKPIDFGAIL